MPLDSHHPEASKLAPHAERINLAGGLRERVLAFEQECEVDAAGEVGSVSEPVEERQIDRDSGWELLCRMQER